MDRSNLKKLVLVATIGFLICIPTVQGYYGQGGTTRPLDPDFREATDDIAAWGDTDTNLVVGFHGMYIEWWHGGEPYPQTIWDCNPQGYILEEELDETHVMITVKLCIRGAYLRIWELVPQFTKYDPILIGTINYYFQIKFIHEARPGDPIPWLYEVYFFGYGQILDLRLLAFGKGEFLVPYGRFEPGDCARVILGGVMTWDPDTGFSYPVEYLAFF
ncbi:MAG: hypothetical protein ACFE8M_11075 [Candidatus Hermodarchaeota archaeon]